MMAEKEHTRAQRFVDRHFSGSLHPEDEHAMHVHLLGCASCSRYYQLRSFGNELDPRGASAEERLARGLGFRPRRPTPWRSPVFAFAAFAPVVALALLLRTAPEAEPPQLFRARGSATAEAVRMLVYRLRPDTPPAKLAGEMAATDELAFSYQNPAGHERLLIFGVDDRKQVFWYYPAWTDASKAPEGVRIGRGHDAKELGEGIRHRLKPGILRLFGLFTNRAYSVTDVERAVAAWKPGETKPLLPETVQVIETVKVLP